jgi:biotin-(acetyl-CoA carboxylase) ligase
VPNLERGAILAAILDAYESRLHELDDPLGIARAWERRADLAGTPYRLLLDGETVPIDATARRLADDGALVVDHAGVERCISLADARVLRG